MKNMIDKTQSIIDSIDKGDNINTIKLFRLILRQQIYILSRLKNLELDYDDVYEKSDNDNFNFEDFIGNFKK